jgi:hypothetical protein
VAADLIERDKAAILWKEAEELVKIMTAAGKTTKNNIHKS